MPALQSTKFVKINLDDQVDHDNDDADDHDDGDFR